MRINMLRLIKRQYATAFRAGQPIFETRPHLVKSGDLTPGISALEYYQRRLKLAEKLPKGSLAILPGSSIKYASGSVFYQFQQNTDLYYLTGWNEPDSVCIIERPENSDDPSDHIFHMAVPATDPAVEQWEGERTGVDGVQEIFNADVGVSTQQFPSHLDKLLRKYSNIYYDIGGANGASGKAINFFERMFPSTVQIDKKSDRANIEEILRKHSNQGFQIRSLNPLVTDLRVIKSNSELKIMRLAGKISGRAYTEAYAKRFQSEKGLHSFLEYRFISGGCDKSAYFPVVAGGDHALCIHYVRNDDVLKDSDMVLVDAAGNLGGYCADISRTWPVNGTFTPAQAELYEALLNVQRRIIRECTVKKGNSLNDLHNLSVDLLTLELRNAGFDHVESWEVSKFLYPHYIGHNLGLDVHDCPLYSRSAKLQKGQVVTVEPGLYIPNDERWPAEYRGMGMRIEDDVAVGEDINVVLTVEAAKEISDIENIAANGVTTPLKEEVVDIYSL
jgi:intermediate cleaving peptidase 55